MAKTVRELVPMHQTFKRLENHSNAANIIEFLEEVLSMRDAEPDFYSALFKWSAEVFPDKMATPLLQNADGLGEVVSIISQDKKMLRELLLDDPDLLIDVAREDSSVIDAFVENLPFCNALVKADTGVLAGAILSDENLIESLIYDEKFAELVAKENMASCLTPKT